MLVLRKLPWIAAALICFAPIARAQEVDHLQAFLVARGDDYFIHAMPASPGHMLVYTIRSSGVMKPFFLAGPKSDVPAHRGVEAADAGETRIMGLIADHQRLYVLARHHYEAGTASKSEASKSETSKPETKAEIITQAEPPPDAGTALAAGRGCALAVDRIRLYVFWQADASMIQELDIDPPAEFSKRGPTLGRGPMKLVDPGQLRLFETTYVFEEKTFKNVVASDGRRFTPPPPDPLRRPRNL